MTVILFFVLNRDPKLSVVPSQPALELSNALINEISNIYLSGSGYKSKLTH